MYSPLTKVQENSWLDGTREAEHDNGCRDAEERRFVINTEGTYGFIACRNVYSHLRDVYGDLITRANGRGVSIGKGRGEIRRCGRRVNVSEGFVLGGHSGEEKLLK